MAFHGGNGEGGKGEGEGLNPCTTFFLGSEYSASYAFVRMNIGVETFRPIIWRIFRKFTPHTRFKTIITQLGSRLFRSKTATWPSEGRKGVDVVV